MQIKNSASGIKPGRCLIASKSAFSKLKVDSEVQRFKVAKSAFKNSSIT